MSVLKTSQVFRLKLQMSEKFILLKLADCADDQGRNAFPSVALLAASCGCNERTVRRALRRLEELGLLEVAAKATNRRPTVYRVRPECGQIDPWFTAPAPEDDQQPYVAEGSNCPPNNSASIAREATSVEGTNLPPKDTPPSPGGTLTPARGGTVPPDPSKRDPSKIKIPAAADASAGVTRAGSTPPSPPPTPSPPSSPGDLLALLDHEHRATFRDPETGDPVPLHITRGKDGRNLRDLVHRDGVDEVLARWRRFLQIRDDRLLDANGYTVSTFLLRYAGLAAKTRARAASAASDDDGNHMQRLRAERDETLRALAAQLYAVLPAEERRAREDAERKSLRARFGRRLELMTITAETIASAIVLTLTHEHPTEAKLRAAIETYSDSRTAASRSEKAKTKAS